MKHQERVNAFDLAARHELHLRAADFCRYATATALARGSPVEAQRIFEQRWSKSRNLELIQRATADPGTASAGGSPPNWGSTLAPMASLAAAFVEFLRPLTVLGRMTGFRPVPFNVSFPVQTEPLSPYLLSRFGDQIREDRIKQMTGHMIRQVLESRGYRVDWTNVRINREGNIFTSATRYAIDT